jgi:hypothetical protein
MTIPALSIPALSIPALSIPAPNNQFAQCLLRKN